MKSKGAFKTIGEVCEIVGLIDPETGKKKTHWRHYDLQNLPTSGHGRYGCA